VSRPGPSGAEASGGLPSRGPAIEHARYHRQILLPDVGAAGQDRLGGAAALVVGCGALGAAIADHLARAGVGRLVIVDRDVLELTNLQRQVLYDERDVVDGLPKAEAARRRLAAINGTIEIRAHVADFTASNAERLAEGADVLVDGLDNFETRYLLNDLAVARGLPYVYGGAVGYGGMGMVVLPGPEARRPGFPAGDTGLAGPCLRCLFPDPPPPGITPTCDTAGVLGPVVAMTAAWQATQTLKLLLGRPDALDRSLWSIDAWTNETRRFDVSASRRADCPCCARGDLDHLGGRVGSRAVTMCGRLAVQVSPGASGDRAGSSAGPDAETGRDTALLDRLAGRLAEHGRFRHNGLLLRGTLDRESASEGGSIELTVFADGRAIVGGTADPERARSIYARYVGL